MGALSQFIDYFINVLIIAIFIRAILAWFPMSYTNPIVTVVHLFTEPVLAPIRRVIPRIGMFDLTPMIAILILYMVRSAI